VRQLRISRAWATRLAGAAVIGVLGFVAAVFLDFEPRPVAFAVMVLLACSMAWLLLDTVNTPPARWLPAVPARGDRTDEASRDLSTLSSHHSATEPSPVLRDRLVSLARGRDPDLADLLRAELTPIRRLKAAEIDRILTRIEESRDPS